MLAGGSGARSVLLRVETGSMGNVTPSVSPVAHGSEGLAPTPGTNPISGLERLYDEHE
jgi:hypothetical protein